MGVCSEGRKNDAFCKSLDHPNERCHCHYDKIVLGDSNARVSKDRNVISFCFHERLTQRLFEYAVAKYVVLDHKTRKFNKLLDCVQIENLTTRYIILWYIEDMYPVFLTCVYFEYATSTLNHYFSAARILICNSITNNTYNLRCWPIGVMQANYMKRCDDLQEFSTQKQIPVGPREVI